MLPINALANLAGGASQPLAPIHPAGPDGWPLDRSAAALKRHVASIQTICDELGRPFEEIAGVYQDELLRMAAGASVLDYLPVLVGKRVRALYRRRL